MEKEPQRHESEAKQLSRSCQLIEPPIDPWFLKAAQQYPVILAYCTLRGKYYMIVDACRFSYMY